MSQHFLKSAAARTLSLSAVYRMSDQEVETAFMKERWHTTGGKPVCPHCECQTVYECRRPKGLLRWRCKACRKDFTVTSGTLFASRKLSLRDYLAAIAISLNEVKGKSSLALSRDLDCQYKAAFVLAAKLREAMSSELEKYRVGGPGEIVEIDGAYFGGYAKPANEKEKRLDRRLAEHQTGKRQVVVVARVRGGISVPWVLKNEAEAVPPIKARVEKGTRLMADEAKSWNALHSFFEMSRINHDVMFSTKTGIHTNNAESFFSRIRRAEIGIHHHVAGEYLQYYADANTWRENNRRLDNGTQVQTILRLALAHTVSRTWSGYWQRSIR
jgi:transposase-like protein